MRAVSGLRKWLHDRPWTFFPMWVVFTTFVVLVAWSFTIETDETRRERPGIGAPL